MQRPERNRLQQQRGPALGSYRGDFPVLIAAFQKSCDLLMALKKAAVHEEGSDREQHHGNPQRQVSEAAHHQVEVQAAPPFTLALAIQIPHLNVGSVLVVMAQMTMRKEGIRDDKERAKPAPEHGIPNGARMQHVVLRFMDQGINRNQQRREQASANYQDLDIGDMRRGIEKEKVEYGAHGDREKIDRNRNGIVSIRNCLHTRTSAGPPAIYAN